MKKWVEYQLKTQVRNFDWENRFWHRGNLFSELGDVFSRIVKGFEDKTVPSVYENVFLREDHIKRTAASTGTDVSENEYRSWLNEYHQLMAGHGHHYINDFGKDSELLKNTFAKKFNLKPETVRMRVQVEEPGKYFVVHIDRHRYRVWDNEPEVRYDKVKAQHSHNIYVTFLQDQQLGQMFQLGTKTIEWKAGDTFAWEHQSVPHCTANAGYWTNYILVTTGDPIDQDDLSSNQNKT